MVQKLGNCSECESEYFLGKSEMSGLCMNCAHHLYGYDNCKHDFVDGRCINCHWDGSTSKYLKK